METGNYTQKQIDLRAVQWSGKLEEASDFIQEVMRLGGEDVNAGFTISRADAKLRKNPTAAPEGFYNMRVFWKDGSSFIDLTRGMWIINGGGGIDGMKEKDFVQQYEKISKGA